MGNNEQTWGVDPDDVQSVSELADAFRRAGMRASVDEIAKAARQYRRNREALARLGGRLSWSDPIATAFSARRDGRNDDER
jgi:hypothetical protein